MDARLDQRGLGLDFPVYRGRSQFGQGIGMQVFRGRGQYGQGIGFQVYRGRGQYGQGIGDIFRGIWRFFRPVARESIKTMFKAGSEAMKDGATLKEVVTNTLKPTISSVLTNTASQVAENFLADKPATAPPPAPVIGVPPGTLVNPVPQVGSGPIKRRSVYKSRASKTKRNARPYAPLSVRYNF